MFEDMFGWNTEDDIKDMENIALKNILTRSINKSEFIGTVKPFSWRIDHNLDIIDQQDSVVGHISFNKDKLKELNIL